MLNNIQVLRAFAALFVVLLHAATMRPGPLGHWFEFGRFGIDIFFVISGFVMVYTVNRRPLGPAQFFTNRVVRIVPLYWALTLAVFCVVLFIPQLLHSTSASPVELVKSLFFVPFQKSNGKIHPVLFPGWTLNYEMFFYALFAIGLFIRRMIVRVAVVSAVLVLIVLMGLIHPMLSVIGQFYASPLLLEFVYGMVIGLAYPALARWRGGVVLPLTLIVVSLALIVVQPLLGPIPYEGVTIGLPSVALVAGVLLLEVADVRATSPALLLLGAASYAIYLSNPFVIGAVEQLLRKLAIFNGIAGVAMAMPVALLVATGFGVLIHLAYERPVDRFLRHHLRAALAPRAVEDSLALWPWRRRDTIPPTRGG